MLKAIPSDYHDKSKGTLKLLWEEEWRAMGITQVRANMIICDGQRIRNGKTNTKVATTESRLGTLRGS